MVQTHNLSIVSCLSVFLTRKQLLAQKERSNNKRNVFASGFGTLCFAFAFGIGLK